MGFGSHAHPLLRELRLIGYSSGNFGKNLLLTSADFTLLFLFTDRLAIAPIVASRLMLVALAGDLILDLIIGAVVTFARAKGVSYRAFLAIGAAPCGAAFALLYALPWLGETRFWAMALALLVFRGAYSVIDVPHNALLAEIAPDSRGRGRVSGYRFFFSVLAGLAVAMVLTPTMVSKASATLLPSIATLGLIAGCCFCLVMLLAAASCRAPEFGARLKASPSMTTIFPKLDRLAFAMAAIAILTGFAMPMFSQMMLYIATYLIGRPMFASQVLTAVCIGQFAGVLLWTLLVRRFEKTTLLGAGHALNMAGVLAFAFAGSSSPLMLGSAGLIGVGLASVYMLPWGLLADVVDFAEYRHRQRREAALFAVFLVIIKASGVASVSFVGWAMAKMHYIPGVTQSAAFHSGVQLLAYGIPFLGSLLAILLMMALPISHHRHAVILRQLNRRKRCSEPQFKPIA